MVRNVKNSQPRHRAGARREKLPALATGVATAIDIIAAGVLIAGPISWGVCIALLGAAAVILALPRARRRELEDDDRHGEGDRHDPVVIRTLVEALPPAEAVMVGGAEERRAILAGLARRADANAVAVMRWALKADPNELGLESALALEDLSIRFERRLDRHRQALAVAPSHAEAMAAGQWIAHGLKVGIIDVVRMRTFAAEARRHFSVARALKPEALADVALAQAQMELAVLRPDRALDLLDEALARASTTRHDELRRLRDEAALRSHDLPWEGPSLLATYRHELPPRRYAGRRGDPRLVRLKAARSDLLRTAQSGTR
jgi:hypothetical protein